MTAPQDGARSARKPGWYWVRGAHPHLSSEWQIAEHTDGYWQISGDENDLLDSDFAEIDERPITRPAGAEAGAAGRGFEAEAEKTKGPNIYEVVGSVITQHENWESDVPLETIYKHEEDLTDGILNALYDAGYLSDAAIRSRACALAESSPPAQGGGRE